MCIRDSIDGILVTHEHSDHIAGLGVLARKYGTPIYATNGTIRAIQNTPSVGKIPDELFHPVLHVHSINVHDLLRFSALTGKDTVRPAAYEYLSLIHISSYTYTLRRQ